MAADTALKRYSVIQLSQPWMGPAYPDTASALARAANLKLYSIEGEEPDPAPTIEGVRPAVMAGGMLMF